MNGRTSRVTKENQRLKAENDLLRSTQVSGPLTNVDLRMLSVKQEVHSGVLTSEAINTLESAVPGAADRILTMAEKQQAHRISIEGLHLNSDISTRAKGQYFAFILCTFAMIATVVLGYMGQTIVGSVLGGSTIVSLAVAFIKGRDLQRVEREEKAKIREAAKELAKARKTNSTESVSGSVKK